MLCTPVTESGATPRLTSSPPNGACAPACIGTTAASHPRRSVISQKGPLLPLALVFSDLVPGRRAPRRIPPRRGKGGRPPWSAKSPRVGGGEGSRAHERARDSGEQSGGADKAAPLVPAGRTCVPERHVPRHPSLRELCLPQRRVPPSPTKSCVAWSTVCCLLSKNKQTNNQTTLPKHNVRKQSYKDEQCLKPNPTFPLTPRPSPTLGGSRLFPG